MRAAVITTLAGPAGVEVREMPEPSTSSGEVLIDVAYAGVGFPDLLQTRGEYQQRPDLPFIPGFEVAGIVRADVGRFRAGDRVAAMPMLGGCAETVAVREDRVFPLPAHVSLDKGAALPLNYLTAHFALTRRARLTSGERVLVHGAAGGVGTAACQLARAYGAVVIAVVSSAEKGRIAELPGLTRLCSSKDSATRFGVSPGAPAWTSLSTRSAETGSSIRSVRWPAKADCSCSASPAARSPPSR